MAAMRSILHPTDFSPASNPAFRKAIELAKALRRQLVLVHILSPVVIPVMGAETYIPAATSATRFTTGSGSRTQATSRMLKNAESIDARMPLSRVTRRGACAATIGVRMTMFSYVRPEQRVPADHPLRPIRTMVDAALRELSPEFARLYPKTGRPSIPPEKLLRALLLQMLYSVRSERQLMEQLDYNLLFRWFVGLSLDDPVWDPTVFTKNRERLLARGHRPGLLRARCWRRRRRGSSSRPSISRSTGR